MAFYTGKGDGGTTKLFDSESGVRVSKSSDVFEALGTLDELNSVIGWCGVVMEDLEAGGRSAVSMLSEVQDHLFTLQAELAGAGKTIPQESVQAIEAAIEHIEGTLPPVTTFLVPGGTERAARLDVARAVSRRAERRLVALNESGERTLSEYSLAYTNRLSSLLYALVRLAKHHDDSPERAPEYRS